MINKTRLLTLSLLITLPFTAFAGTIQLPQTGQTTCYDPTGAVISCAGTGQDGDLRIGVPWPNPRFSASGDCVTDNLTGLMWAKDANLAGALIWQRALDWVDSLNSTGGLCGYTDWRLPNRKELRSLVNRGQDDNASWLNTQGFNNVLEYYWSSSTYAQRTDEAWFVSVSASGGFAYPYSKTAISHYVWPVRSGQ